MHDFHPPVSVSGLYWIANVREKALTISSNGRSATLDLKDIPVIDQPKWPAKNAETTPARMSVRVIWTATDEALLFEDKCRHFRMNGYLATAQAAASVEVPSTGFSWKSDALETSKAGFAVIGSEVNGKYYDIAVI